MTAQTQRDRTVDAALDAYKALMRVFHATAEPCWRQLDLTITQLKGLFLLADDGPLTVGAVADALGVGKPAASILIDQGVRAGLIERNEDPVDRRRTIVHLSIKGDELVTQLQQGEGARLRAWFGRLGDDDLAALIRGLQALVAAVAADDETTHGTLHRDDETTHG